MTAEIEVVQQSDEVVFVSIILLVNASQQGDFRQSLCEEGPPRFDDLYRYMALSLLVPCANYLAE